ncbi:uncharacterized protein LOC131286458 [Anopheles ziemanni]|uniref:uncharacterized protein LOC131262168 n=1 Tax=Anopheles coustani TaxID=139045 RepID=UPI0026588BD2|nr:uncharacterized protein LOC131262168 [Anopheles coustani]XP_058171398.1 uncharacterized protein LOC131286458 [Anopheles ziemanni]
MNTLTQDLSAEDYSSSNFQQASSGSVATSSTQTIRHPSTRRQQLNTVPSRKVQQARTAGGQLTVRVPQRRGPVHGDDTADCSSDASLGITGPPVSESETSSKVEDDNVAAGIEDESASDNSQLSGGSALNEKTRRYNRISMIIVYGREALCILALILTTYATIQNSPPKISKAPPAVPFFPKGSLVHDWPTGALGTTQTRVSVSELSFVLYYAPWCAESQYARQAYEQVAQLFYREAHFAAINCWQPGGECRQRYSKVQAWPVLMAYQSNGLAVQYHQAWTATAFSRFVQSLMLPLHRFSNPSDLLDHMTGKDAVIVAFLEMANESKLYQRYYQASLKWLEKDPFQELSFGVVTGQSSKMFGIETVPSIRLYLWNETIEYVGNSSWTPQELIAWINKHLHVASMWLAPPGATKSTTIAPYLQQGPVLMLFSPRPLYDDSSDAYMMLRQLSMQYYNCPGDAWILEMAREYIAEQRTLNAERFVQRREQCARILGRHPSQEDEEDDADESGVRKYRRNRCKDGFKSTVSVSFVNVLNSSKFVDGKPVGKAVADEYCDIAPALGCGAHECGALGPERRLSLRWNSGEDGCPSRGGKPVNSQSRTVTSKWDSEHDYRGPKLLAKQNLRRQCELLRLAETDGANVYYSEPVPSKNQSAEFYTAIMGLSCSQNKSLTFLSMDSNLYHAFGERLGVNVLNEPNRTVAFIIDHQDESTYVLRDRINLNTLAKFVHDYHNRTLVRFQRSGNIHYQHTHPFDGANAKKQSKQNLEKHYEQLERVAKSKARSKPSKKAEQQANSSPLPPSETNEQLQANLDAMGKTSSTIPTHNREHHSVREIYSSNFRRVVLDSNRTVVVSFYSTQCAFCNILSHHLLTVSRLLRQQPALEFVRIDGDRNELGWEYTMDVFPSLIIFPNGRKSESRIFPHTLKVNVPNVVGFVLSNLTPSERLHANFLLCGAVNKASRTDCLQMLKRELTESIRLSLREWRHRASSACERDRIVRRLQLLKQSYLGTLRCLSHSCDLSQLVVNERKLIQQLWTGSSSCVAA